MAADRESFYFHTGMDATRDILQQGGSGGASVRLVRAVLVLAAVAGSGAGCFLHPSPDDSWSDAYGRVSPDANGASTDAAASAEASGVCARAVSCVKCCDGSDLSAGEGFFSAAWGCACPAGRCSPTCGGACASPPDHGLGCLSCIAEEAKGACASGPIATSCAVGSACHDYALCIADCEKP